MVMAASWPVGAVARVPAELLSVVGTTVRPAHASVWIRPAGR
jgi:hypothetical protein